MQVPSPPVEALQNHQWSLVVVQLSGVVPGLSRRAGHLSSCEVFSGRFKRFGSMAHFGGVSQVVPVFSHADSK